MKKVTEREVGRICRLIQDYIYENEKIVLGCPEASIRMW